MLEGFIDAGSNDTALGVHYDVDLNDAIKHFEEAGFTGISNIEKVKGEIGCNCNMQRNTVIDMAKRYIGLYFFQGNWDSSLNKCTIYKFKFTAYEGGGQTDKKNGFVEYSVWYTGN